MDTIRLIPVKPTPTNIPASKALPTDSRKQIPKIKKITGIMTVGPNAKISFKKSMILTSLSEFLTRFSRSYW